MAGQMKYDIVLANIPKTRPNGPYLGTFLLKAVVQKHGFSCKSFDWNRDLYDRVKDKNTFSRSDLYFNLKEHFEEFWEKEVNHICDTWMEQLKECDPEWFGITFMSQRQCHMGERIIEVVRKRFPNIKIVIGGFYVAFEKVPFGQQLLDKGLIDYYVNGEGEDAIVELLKGNDTFQGINSLESTPSPDLNSNPSPDFSDVSHYDYTEYYAYNSRGCINRCSFCTENKYGKFYRFRNSELVLQDILNVTKIANSSLRRIVFVDSLINGHPKKFKQLISMLDGKGIKWYGQYLCNSWMGDEEYKLARRAGLVDLNVGVESASERIRNEMGKGFTNESLYKTFKCATKNRIYVMPMLIIGWPSETEEDFQETLDFLAVISKYDYISIVNPGPTLRINHGVKMLEQFELGRDEYGKWFYKDNTYSVRKERWCRLVDHCKEVGLDVNEYQRDKVEENYNGSVN